MEAVLALRPAKLSQKTFMRSNVFIAHSRKMHGREVQLVGPTAYDAWLIIEFDPAIVAFCERPEIALPLGNHRARGLDLWVARKDGSQSAIVLFGSNRSDAATDGTVLERAVRACGFNCEIWNVPDLARRLTEIRNYKMMQPFLAVQNWQHPSLVNDIGATLAYLDRRGLTLRDLWARFRQESRTIIASNLFALRHAGRAVADLEHETIIPTTSWYSS